MKRNVLLIPFVAVMTLLVLSMASAMTDSADIVDGGISTEFNGVSLVSGSSMTGDVGETVPVRVTFVADDNVSDVRVEVSMNGFREDIEAESSRFSIIDGKTYTKLLSLRLPSSSYDSSKDYVLKVSITHDGSNAYEEYTINMQREDYTFEIKSIDYSSKVNAGDVFPVSVVVKNVGYNRMDDTYVVVSIPALSVSARGYVGDLIPTDKDEDNKDKEDSMYRTVYLKIPADADSGVYEMEVEAYNDDSKVVTKQLVSIGELASSVVLTTVKNQNLKCGETVAYDLVIVNSADSVKIFNLESVHGDGLSVSVPSVITVGPDASKTISVMVTAAADAELGAHAFSVDVDGEQVVFGANVVSGSISSSVIALTVILVIVFVVLLVVLVVLLTKKEKPMEEVETSYY